MTTYTHAFSTPVGTMRAFVDGAGAITGLEFGGARAYALATRLKDLVEDAAATADVETQLAQYFSGDRRDFDLALAPRGTAFQLRVWEALREIPYGRTISYGELARRLGSPSLTRAVGTANGANPIAIVLPCHRVIGADGRLVGYGGGLDTKAFLLGLEGALPGRLAFGAQVEPRSAG